MDMLSTAAAGAARAQGRFTASAARVAAMGSGPQVDLVRETAAMIEAKQAFSANLQVVRFADDLWRALLDIQGRED